jgi:hypothetical protein
MLAYVFWHWPRPGTDAQAYADRLLAFHRALRASPSRGFAGSRVLAVEGAPWCAGAPAFEDWYLVEDWAALGALDEAAVTASRHLPHDAIAALAGGGAGGVYRRLADGPWPPPAGLARWFAKPDGERYATFQARLPAGVEVWQRQLVLGPAPEYCAFGTLPAGVVAADVRFEVR